MRRHLILTFVALGSIALAACSSESQDAEQGYGILEAPLTASGVTATLSLSPDWGTGYCADVKLVNANSAAISSWKMTIDLKQTTVTGLWSANYSVSAGIMTVTSTASIAAAGSTTFRFCANATSATNRPIITALTVVGGGGGGTGGSPATGGASSTGGSGATAGTTSFTCGLPVAGNTGVAKPSGTPGNLKILNWAGLKAAVSYTFDDANSSQIQHYADLKALGVPLTFYLWTGKAEASNAIWAQAVTDGHELGNHTQTHNSTATAADIDAAQTFLQQKFGVRAWTMAAPNGSSSYIPFAQTRFLLNRGVSNALIAPNGATNPFDLPTFIPPTGASAATFNSQIDAAQTAGAWRVVLVHGFTGGSDGAYQPVDFSAFASSVQHTKALGNMWIDTMTKIGAYWRGQKLVTSVAPTTSGTSKIWNWTLPANFPPSKCLRVTVDGGTLKQGGKTLVWNSRGYYEISLDAGSLTLAP